MATQANSVYIISLHYILWLQVNSLESLELFIYWGNNSNKLGGMACFNVINVANNYW